MVTWTIPGGFGAKTPCNHGMRFGCLKWQRPFKVAAAACPRILSGILWMAHQWVQRCAVILTQVMLLLSAGQSSNTKRENELCRRFYQLFSVSSTSIAQGSRAVISTELWKNGFQTSLYSLFCLLVKIFMRIVTNKIEVKVSKKSVHLLHWVSLLDSTVETF